MRRSLPAAALLAIVLVGRGALPAGAGGVGAAAAGHVVASAAVPQSPAPKAGDGPVPACVYDPTDFANAFLDELGVPDSPANVEAIVGWEEAEGGNWENGARFNPLDTTYVLDGSYPMNSVGVQAYSSWSVGIRATILTIDNGLYHGILAALARGNDPVAVARAVGASPWGTPDYEDLLPPSYDPRAPAWEPFCLSDGTFFRVGTSLRVSVVAGDAPLPVTSWASVGGPQPTVQVNAGRLATLASTPLAGTLLCAGTFVFEVVGGAPLYVSSYAGIGGPRPCVRVDPAAVAEAGGAAPFDHLVAWPADGTVLEVGAGGPRYVVEQGVPEYTPWPTAAPLLVDAGVILHEGGVAPYDHLLAPDGYRLATADGTVFSQGQLLDYGSLGSSVPPVVVVAVASTADGGGYLEVTSDGGVAAYGDARYLGDLPSRHVHVSDIVAIAMTPDGGGYWLIGADGGMFAFGDAGFFGSLPGIGAKTDDVVGIVAAPEGTGYLLVGRDGGVFAFGHGVAYHGSLPGLHITVDDVRAIVTSPAEAGYVLVAADGGTFVFGTGARFVGSLPGRGVVVDDVVGLALSRGDSGYWMATASGAVYAFGTAPVLVPSALLLRHLPVAAVAGG